MITLTSHPLCPLLHAWSLALTLADNTEGTSFVVKRLPYADMPRWAEEIPTGASLPFVTTAGMSLGGGLPVLQFLEETIPRSALLPTDPLERVAVRNRALLAVDVFNVLRPVFVAQTRNEEMRARDVLFATLMRCEGEAWSTIQRLDWVLLAAASTLIAVHPKLMDDPRFAQCPGMYARISLMSGHDAVVATRAPDYEAEFGRFFRAFGSNFDRDVSAGNAG
jgi:glutathione S-transferase